MIKLLLHESKRRVGSPGVFITPGTYFIQIIRTADSILETCELEFPENKVLGLAVIT